MRDAHGVPIGIPLGAPTQRDSRADAAWMADALASGRVVYTSSWWRDAAFYLANNHVLLSICCAHPLHPFSRCRRALVLVNSVTFGFFIEAALHSLLPFDPIVATFRLTLGVLLQLAFDLPAALLGTCPCARCLPEPFGQWLRCVSMGCLACHCCQGLLYAFLGLVLLLISPLATPDGVWRAFVATKEAAFVVAIPTTLIVYALLRECERGAGCLPAHRRLAYLPHHVQPPLV